MITSERVQPLNHSRVRILNRYVVRLQIGMDDAKRVQI